MKDIQIQTWSKAGSMQNTTSDTYNAAIKECVTGGMWILMERAKRI